MSEHSHTPHKSTGAVLTHPATKHKAKEALVVSKWEKRPTGGWQQLRLTVNDNGKIKAQLAVRPSISHYIGKLISRLIGKDNFGIKIQSDDAAKGSVKSLEELLNEKIGTNFVSSGKEILQSIMKKEQDHR